MKKAPIVIMLILSVLIVSCRSTDEGPSWLRDGGYSLDPDYYYGIGTSSLDAINKDEQIARDQAELNARYEMAAQIMTYIESHAEEYRALVSDVDAYERDFQNYIEQSVNQVVTRAVLQDSWKNYTNGTISVLMSMPKSDVDSAITQKLKIINNVVGISEDTADKVEATSGTTDSRQVLRSQIKETFGGKDTF